MNNFAIKNFIINGLFNEYNVNLPLDQEVNVFLGENGMGKTTILNALYCVLSGNYEKLTTMDFESISVIFANGEECSITRQDIVAYYDDYYYSTPKRRRFDYSKLFNEKELLELRNIYIHNLGDSDIFKKCCYKVADILGMPISYAKQELERFIFNYSPVKGNLKNVETFRKKISSAVNTEILYFPTYRRIEEDMSKLGLDMDKERLKDHLIRFGMADVEKSIKEILSTISGVAIDSFAEMTGILLNQYLSGSLEIGDDYFVDRDKLSIALDRIGEKINAEDKLKIKEMVLNKNIYFEENKYLLNLIKNLIDSYEKQSYYDERVKRFKDVCNGYLTGKKYRYDESNLTLAIYKDNQDQPINVQSLSSGEKQVISIFSKLYLEENKNCIILFDEPELSLSIKWQATFLPDIMKSEKCKMLIAVTHSPFIFDNEYDNLAKYMGEYLTPAK